MQFEANQIRAGRRIDAVPAENDGVFMPAPPKNVDQPLSADAVNPGDFDQNIQRLTFLQQVENDYEIYVGVLREWQNRVSFDEVRDEEKHLSRRVEGVLDGIVERLKEIQLTSQGVPGALKASLLRLMRNGLLDEEIARYEELVRSTKAQVALQKELVYGRSVNGTRPLRVDDPNATGIQALSWKDGETASTKMN